MSRRPGKKGNGGGGVDVDVRPQEDGGGRGIEVAAPAVTMRDGKAAGDALAEGDRKSVV